MQYSGMAFTFSVILVFQLLAGTCEQECQNIKKAGAALRALIEGHSGYTVLQLDTSQEKFQQEVQKIMAQFSMKQDYSEAEKLRHNYMTWFEVKGADDTKWYATGCNPQGWQKYRYKIPLKLVAIDIVGIAAAIGGIIWWKESPDMIIVNASNRIKLEQNDKLGPVFLTAIGITLPLLCGYGTIKKWNEWTPERCREALNRITYIQEQLKKLNHGK